ncbi:hypothetical protein VKT23_003625 [Stygiomarasmius scandens]|uniref:Pet127-domain-containing protein n=1 Tax=Marasmiellus scandens TaxID=2682957 RepID=A0ABR1JYJ0_9AGAR
MSLWNHARTCSRFPHSTTRLIRAFTKPAEPDTTALYSTVTASLPTKGSRFKRRGKTNTVDAAERATGKAEKESNGVLKKLTDALESNQVDPKEEKKQRAKEKKAKAALKKKQGSSQWPPEKWQNDWGEDELKPLQDSKQKAPDRPTLVPPYSRKTEGLLEEGKKVVLQDLPSPTKQNPVATLSHGLERVLFNPGVHWLRDPRSRVYNFPPALEIIPKVIDFAFERLTGFIKSSRDEDLWTLVKKEGKKFSGSTSSLSGMLSQIYFLVSGDRRVDISTLSLAFKKEPVTFTPGQRMAASVVFNYKDGVYAIDSDPSKNDDVDKNILTWMGTLLEKYLTTPSKEFLTYMRSHPTLAEALEDDPTREAYRYSKSEKFVMRSQLDCHDTRLPGTGVFDIKTRACLPIRMDLLNYNENSGYLIHSQHGLVESFEREYYDLIRSAFLKYSFQVRIGNMDGVLVAYHNTERMFGFQYVPLEEMDKRLFGPEPGAGDRVFQKCVELLEVVAEEVVSCFPQQSVQCTFETLENSGTLNIWIEPTEWTPDTANPEGSRPIKQIVVSASSFLGGESAKPFVAVADTKQPWTLHWSISHLAGGPDRERAMRDGLRGAKERQFRAYSLPSGTDHESIRKWWEGVDFARGIDENQRRAIKELGLQPGIPPIDGEKVNTVTEDGMEVEVDISSAVPRKPDSFFEDNFQLPDRRINELRQLARKGRKLSIQRSKEERGKPKVQLGVGEIPWVETEVDLLHKVAEEENAKAKELFREDKGDMFAEQANENMVQDLESLDSTVEALQSSSTFTTSASSERSAEPTPPAVERGQTGMDIPSRPDDSLFKPTEEELTDGDSQGFAEQRVRLSEQAHEPLVEIEETVASGPASEVLQNATSIQQDVPPASKPPSTANDASESSSPQPSQNDAKSTPHS